jgi:hypothetical protein
MSMITLVLTIERLDIETYPRTTGSTIDAWSKHYIFRAADGQFRCIGLELI